MIKRKAHVNNLLRNRRAKISTGKIQKISSTPESERINRVRLERFMHWLLARLTITVPSSGAFCVV